MTEARVSTQIRGQTPVDVAYEEFAATAVLQDAVDPVITELVRLRCARHHDCRLCGSLREVNAREAGLDEARIDAVLEAPEAADEATAVALALAEAMITAPGSVDEVLRARARESFTDEQIAEILFDVMKWSFQKGLVALRIEPPIAGGIGDLAFDDAGNPVIAAAGALA